MGRLCILMGRGRGYSLVEGDLLAGGLDDAASAGAAAGRSTTATATTTATAAATAEAATATAATTTTAATEAATTAVVVRLRGSEVDTDAARAELGAVKGLEGGGGLGNVAEGDVAEALGGTGFPVGGETDGLDVTVLAEGLVDVVLGRVEGKRADPEGVGGGRALVVEDLGALVGVRLASVGEVDTDGTAVELLALELNGLDGRVDVGELDVAESTRALGVAVKNDAGRDDLTARGELGSEPVVVDVPRKTTDENGVGGLLLALRGLNLLDGGGGGGSLGLLLSLALVGSGLGLLLVVGRVRVGRGVRVRRRGRGGLLLLLLLLLLLVVRVRVGVRRVRGLLLLGGSLGGGLGGGLLVLRVGRVGVRGVRVRRVRRLLLLGGGLALSGLGGGLLLLVGGRVRGVGVRLGLGGAALGGRLLLGLLGLLLDLGDLLEASATVSYKISHARATSHVTDGSDGVRSATTANVP